MTNMIPFVAGQVPAHIASAFAADESNIAPKITIPSLSFRGKSWRIVLDDQETLVTNKDGEPSTIVSVFILDQIKRRSRNFYEGDYVPGENKAPRCSSIDGVTPDAFIVDPIATTCATCPNAVKGSKITPSGKATTLCAATKRVAVLPAAKLDFPALLMRLAQTSMWDKNTEKTEWRAWDQYMDFLRASGVTNTVQVVTKIKFDHTVEYPKLLFKADRWATAEELAVLSERWKSDEVRDLLFGRQEPPATDDDVDDAPAPAAAAPAPAPEPAPAPTPEPAPAPATANAGLSSLLGSWDD